VKIFNIEEERKGIMHYY